MALIMVFVLGFAALFALGAGRGAEGLSTTLLQGPDDQMRMVQVLDWLNGQAWADTTQRRLDPPDGVPMHWSRIADLPVAALILTFELLADREAAAVWAAMLAPALLGGLFAALFVWAALPLTEGRALVPVLMIGTLVIPFQQFLPGRIDHHGLQLTLTVLALGCLLRVLIHHSNWAAVGIGIAGALSLAIGLEALPFLGAATLALTLAWIVAGDAGGARGLAVFGVSLAAATLALIHLTLPPDAWVVAACDRISLAHVGLTAIVPAAGLGALALALWRPEAGWALRFALMAVIGVTGLALVALAFPHCVGSPYAGLPAEVRYWFEKVSEAQPFHLYFLRKPGAAVAFAALPVAALVSLILCWTRTTDRRTALWPGLLVLVLSGFALLLWQIRGVTYAALTAGLGLIPFAAAVNGMADRARSILARVGLRVTVPMLAVIAVMAPYALITPEAQQQKDATARAGCEVEAAREALNDPVGLGARPLTIAAPVDAGPAVLLLSPHRVLAAPYHRNVQGLVDNRRIFAGTEDEALRTIARRKVGAIL
ncbi:MAG TPA: hypothetical protein VLN73_02740, partial [Alphaproteobacteria bacterium]|nr:hypothetical protein [Alphaproteobacteria bacterium]